MNWRLRESAGAAWALGVLFPIACARLLVIFVWCRLRGRPFLELGASHGQFEVDLKHTEGRRS